MRSIGPLKTVLACICGALAVAVWLQWPASGTTLIVVAMAWVVASTILSLLEFAPFARDPSVSRKIRIAGRVSWAVLLGGFAFVVIFVGWS